MSGSFPLSITLARLTGQVTSRQNQLKICLSLLMLIFRTVDVRMIDRQE